MQARGPDSSRDYPVVQSLCGTCRILLHLMGDVNMAYALYDHPGMVHEIMQQWLVMNERAVDRVMQVSSIHVA